VEERGSIAVTARPRFIRLWDVHPEPVLAEIPIEALPIIGGMRATRAQLGEAMQRLTEVRDRELRSRLFSELATWASLNYNEIEINEIRARSRMTFEELFLMSPFSEMLLKEAQEKAQREGLREGRQEGRQEGLQEGQIEGARSSLLSLADIRFPGLITAADVEPITDLDTIGRIFRALAIASDRDAANAAVQELRASHS